ncbi:MAG: HNH endonuclease [Paeniclostridium sordellii]|nr:HNH endonuclease [Paeniclostridium sordellii]
MVWLSKGGDDTIENTAALCPNCHRKMHIINDEEDVEYLRNKIY